MPMTSILYAISPLKLFEKSCPPIATFQRVLKTPIGMNMPIRICSTIRLMNSLCVMSVPRIFTDTSQCLFQPIECLEKRAALMPRPAVNVLPYHGVLLLRAR